MSNGPIISANQDLIVLRRNLLASGYHPVPNKGKSCYLLGWTRAEYFTSAEVDNWTAQRPDWRSTGVRLDNGLRAIDFDVDDKTMLDRLWEELDRIAPEIIDRAPMRGRSNSQRFTLFARAGGEDDRPFTLLPHRTWHDSAGTEHTIEIFGSAPTARGNCSRQFGAYGPHSPGSDYLWLADDGRPPLHEVKLTELPTLSFRQGCELQDAFDRLAKAAGWEMVQALSLDGGTNKDVFDIDEASRFTTNHGDIGITYQELCELYADELRTDDHADLRCTTAFIAGRSGESFKCKLHWSKRFKCVGVHVFGDDVNHYPKEAEPKPDRMQEILRSLTKQAINPDKEPSKPAHDAEMTDKVEWLIATRAYWEHADKVVPIYAVRTDCGVKPEAFKRAFKSWFAMAYGRGVPKPVFAADTWELAPHRVQISNVEMRPDMSFPLFEDAHGNKVKNTYLKPTHSDEGGDVAPFLRFIARFIPDDREREWLLDWMAHKQAWPAIPGVAVVMVATSDEDIRQGVYGTGRGLLFGVLRQLYGEDYVRAEDFNIIDGSSPQSTYTDWMHKSVLVTVDEARSSPTAYRKGERDAVYEVLKNVVDPAPKFRSFKRKNLPAFDGWSFVSMIIATNHGDAFAIPVNDRRFTILRNGRPMDKAEVDEFLQWRGNPRINLDNIGALSRYLAARDLTSFNMAEAPMTEAKTEMAELARSEVEEFMRDLMEDPPGLAFTREQMRARVMHNSEFKGMIFDGHFKEAWSKMCGLIKGLSPGQPKEPIRVSIAGTTKKLFCFNRHKPVIRKMTTRAIKREAVKWGGVDPSEGSETIGGVSQKDE